MTIFLTLFRYSLRGNYIEVIPLEPFRVLRQLDRLDLGENFLTSIPPIMFNGTLTVNDLNMEYNYLERLEDSAFISLQPRRLYLGHNRISDIDGQAFNGVDLLVELIDLEANRLSSISEVRQIRTLTTYTIFLCIYRPAQPNVHVSLSKNVTIRLGSSVLISSLSTQCPKGKFIAKSY